VTEEASNSPVRGIALLPSRDRGGELAWWLATLFLATLVVGVLVMRGGKTRVGGNELSIARAVFVVANAATLTGFRQDISANDLLPLGQAVVFALTIAGTIFALTVGGMALCRILRLPYRDRRLILAATICQVMVVLIGLIILSGGNAGRAWGAVVAAAAAFANSGLYVGSPPELLHWQTHVVILPLALLGGLGLPVLLEICDRLRGKKELSVHARTVLSMSAGIYLLGLVLFLGLQLLSWGNERELTFGEVRQALASSSAAVLATRTAGTALDFSDLFPSTVFQWLGMVLMVIGASPGGTGGGIKTTTLAELCAGVPRVLRGDTVRRAFGIAGVWVGGYLAIVFLGVLMILASEPNIPPDRVLFLVISAASNVGLSHDPVGITGVGLYTLSGIMLLGRLAPLGVLWWMAGTTRDAELAIG
jgi:trk system potassium uptake protein TrkH